MALCIREKSNFISPACPGALTRQGDSPEEFLFSQNACLDIRSADRIRTFCGQNWPVRSWESLETGHFRSSAVLIPLFMDGDALSTIFTVRPDHLRRHPGQISFPGGAREPGDISPGDTALREAREELGLSAANVGVLGMFPPEVAFTSDFLVFPLIGWIDPPETVNALVPDPQEVDRLIRVPLCRFSPTPSFEWKREGDLSFVYPVFPLKGEAPVWGVTARILLRLIRLLHVPEIG